MIRRCKLCIILLLAAAGIFSYANLFAWDRHDRYDRHHRYHYRDGRWYRSGWMGFDIAVSALAIGAIVDGLPHGYTTVVYGGNPYYYYDGLYYRPYAPSGYIVVEPPPRIITAEPLAVTQDQGASTVVINVPNSKGGYTPVTLTRKDNGYVGPQGEYYPGNPSVEQLRALYGK